MGLIHFHPLCGHGDPKGKAVYELGQCSWPGGGAESCVIQYGSGDEVP